VGKRGEGREKLRRKEKKRKGEALSSFKSFYMLKHLLRIITKEKTGEDPERHQMWKRKKEKKGKIQVIYLE